MVRGCPRDSSPLVSLYTRSVDRGKLRAMSALASWGNRGRHGCRSTDLRPTKRGHGQTDGKPSPWIQAARFVAQEHLTHLPKRSIRAHTERGAPIVRAHASWDAGPLTGRSPPQTTCALRAMALKSPLEGVPPESPPRTKGSTRTGCKPDASSPRRRTFRPKALQSPVLTGCRLSCAWNRPWRACRRKVRREPKVRRGLSGRRPSRARF
jgi:hypothetical protein